MAAYKRLVSYMYNYENGIKGSNVGYARVESKSGQCKVYIRIRVPSLNDSELKVYFFKRDGYSIEGIPLGALSVKNGLGQFRAMADSGNIMNSSYDLDDIGGMVLYHTDNKYIATEWDDKPVTKEMVNTSLLMPRQSELVKDKDVSEITQIKDTDKVANEEIFKKDDKAIIEEVALEIDNLNREEISKEIDKLEREDLSINMRKSWPVFEEHPDALNIYSKFPKMYPFEDNEVAWCVRFEPQDIGVLPMDNWSLGNNSFLLHGFYCYSHLIFARINDKNGIKYILGVPGIYHNRERFMAKMFGFDFFKSIKRKELRVGEFGYWYAPIYFN